MNRRRFLALLGAVIAAPFVPSPEPAPVLPEPLPPAPLDTYSVHYWLVNANSGTYAGIDRTAYPGRLSTPTIHTDGVALTPGVCRVAMKHFEESFA